jgi:hypothetical protein
MMSKDMFSAEDLAALDDIAAECAAAGMLIERDDTHRLMAIVRGFAGAKGASVLARIHPAREKDGVTVTVTAGGERKFLDGPAMAFTEGGRHRIKLRDWLAQHLS